MSMNKVTMDDIESRTDPSEAAAAEEDRLKSLCATRRGKLGVCTRKQNEIKALLVPGGNIENVNGDVIVFKSCQILATPLESTIP